MNIGVDVGDKTIPPKHRLAECEDAGARLPCSIHRQGRYSRFGVSSAKLLEHLEAKVRSDIHKLHPLIDDFIPTLEDQNGICSTHPQKLPGLFIFFFLFFDIIDHKV